MREEVTEGRGDQEGERGEGRCFYFSFSYLTRHHINLVGLTLEVWGSEPKSAGHLLSAAIPGHLVGFRSSFDTCKVCTSCRHGSTH